MTRPSRWSHLYAGLGVRVLGRTRFARAWLVMAALLLAVKQELPAAHRVWIPVRLPSGRWYWLGDVSEMLVLYEVFVEHIYAVPELPEHAPLILDLGANAGAASVFFAERYPSAEILAYEADPRVAARARRNTTGLRVQVTCGAVGAGDAAVTLHRPRGHSWGTSVHAPTGEAFTARGITVDEIIGDREIPILKIDIEGSEYAALRASAQLHRVALILGEFHPLPDVSSDDFFPLLDGFELLSGGGPEMGEFVGRRRTAPVG